MEWNLDDLAARIHLPGWHFWVERTDATQWLHMGLDRPPDDNRHPGHRLDVYGDRFVVPRQWSRQQTIERLFANLQFLLDHELREGFTVDGVRVFEAHEPSVTGEQHDWFVERQAALRGY